MKNTKKVRPKKPIPKGSHALKPFCFELMNLYRLIEECESRKLWSLAIALEQIRDGITTKRDLYVWTED